MSTDNALEFLEHYGVRGQKWGVRNTSRSSGSSKGSSDSKGGSGDSGGSGGSSGPGSKSAKSKTAHLSNDELKKVIDRMRLDQQYSELTSPKKQGGKKYVSNILKESGNKLAGAAATAVAGILVARALGQYTARSKANEQIMVKTLLNKAAVEDAFKHPPKFP